MGLRLRRGLDLHGNVRYTHAHRRVGHCLSDYEICTALVSPVSKTRRVSECSCP